MIGFNNLILTSLSARGRTRPAFMLAAIALLAPTVVWAADGGTDMAWGAMIMQLAGGLALFLFGMEQMADALKNVAGDSMRQVLSKLTNSRFMGMLTGAFVTAIIQSSSVTTVMLVGFVTANLMSLSQAIGVILGADIGTTITAQIVAFKVTKYALLLIAIGFLMIFASKKNRTKQYGALVMGLGLIFFGMGVMSDGMKPLRTYEPFIALMQDVANPFVGILVATLFTGLVQSSSATMGVVIALALQGLINLEAGIALALGANIGTCVTAGLASIGKPREAIRVAVAHVTFKVVGVFLIVWFIPYFADLVRSISPVADTALVGVDKLAVETPRQIANAHTIFNIGIAILFLPFTTFFARFCEWVVPDKDVDDTVIARPKYLDKELLSTPALALDRVRHEIGHMGGKVELMMGKILPAMMTGKREDLQEIARMDDEVDILHSGIVKYLGDISRQPLSGEQTRHFLGLMEATNDLESIGDLMETDLAALGEQRIAKDLVISGATQAVLSGIHDKVSVSIADAVQGITKNDEVAAQRVTALKSEIQRLTDEAASHQAQRLVADEPKRLPTYSLEIEVIEKLKRMYYFAKRMAKTTMPQELLEKE